MTAVPVTDPARAALAEAEARAQIARTDAEAAERRAREAQEALEAATARLAAWENVRGDLRGHLVGIVNEADARALDVIATRARDALALIPGEG